MRAAWEQPCDGLREAISATCRGNHRNRLVSTVTHVLEQRLRGQASGPLSISDSAAERSAWTRTERA